MNHVRFVLAVIAAMSIASVSSVHGESSAPSRIDQQHIVSDVLIAYPAVAIQRLAQTFTVGITGELDRLDLQVGSGPERPIHPLTVEILKTNPDGTPDFSTSLVSITFTPSISLVPLRPSLLRVDFLDQQLSVHAGDVLAIGLSSNAYDIGGRYFWAGRERLAAESYLAGDLYTLHTFDYVGLQNRGPTDCGFRTYVRPIPEPSTLTLTWAGVFAAGAVLRRRARINSAWDQCPASD